MELEDEFDVSIPDEDAEKIQTVGDAVKYINEHTQKNECVGQMSTNPVILVVGATRKESIHIEKCLMD